MLYRLNSDRSVSPCSPEEHMRLISNPDYRRLARDEFNGYAVSTTFSGVDLRSIDKPLPAPLLFSVTVFDPDIAILALMNCASWQVAMARHALCFKALREILATAPVENWRAGPAYRRKRQEQDRSPENVREALLEAVYSNSR